MAKNTTPEMYDENTETESENGMTALDNKQILMSENDILQGLLALGSERDNEANYRNVEIRRGGKLMLAFRIRPLSEEENQTCWRRATKYSGNKPGQPKVAIQTDNTKYRSLLVYTATVDEDREKIWNNKEAQRQLNVVQPSDLIDKVLFAGEKSRIIDLIDEISGFGDDEADETAKN